MDGGGIWRAAPSAIDQCLGEWLQSTRRTADLLRRVCHTIPPAPIRPRAGPVVACIDLTEDDFGDDDNDATLVVVDLANNNDTLVAHNNDNAVHQNTGIDGMDEKRQRSAYEGTADNASDVQDKSDDDQIHLVRRRRRPRQDASRKRRRRHDAIPTAPDQAVPLIHDDDPTQFVPRTPPPSAPMLLPSAVEPTSSAPSVSLFDWDAFRLSLCDLADPHSGSAHDRPRPLPDTLFGDALFSPRSQHRNMASPCWDISPLQTALSDLVQAMPPPGPVSIAVDQAAVAPASALPMGTSRVLVNAPAFCEASALHATVPDPYEVASAPPHDLFATDSNVPSCHGDNRSGESLPQATALTPSTCDPTIMVKPAAGLGDMVLVNVGGRQTVAVLARFDGVHYGLALPRADDDAVNYEKDRRWLCLSVSGAADDGTRWHNAQLGECAVCMDAEAMAFLGCRCTVPATCMDCAVRLDQCPYCDAASQSDPIPIERDLYMAPATSPWIDVPLRIVLDGVRGPTSRRVRAQVDWPGVLLRAVAHETIGDARRDMRLLVGGRTIVDQRPIGAQGVVDGALVCVIPRLRGD
ncbi:Zinc-finger domain containing protein [Pandoravirus celtis]|uniref:Zinc-finger domain containing protein n=1 Tax=Pandoravirus celtis TaxID=2568002 RepID=A0A4D6EIA9_9VIRU|nr:Zinc-finger domain containing protein [Pandoravirus celtis]